MKVAIEVETRPQYDTRDERVLVGVYEDGTREDLIWLGPVKDEEEAGVEV